MYEPIRILIIDDESLVRWALASILTTHGCVIVERADAGSGMQALTESPGVFDVILLDHRLPDGNGLDLLPTFKQLAPTSSVLMMSAYMSGDEVDEALRLGASACMAKPFDLEAMWEQILNFRCPPIFISPTERWRGNTVPSRRRPVTSRPLPMILASPVAKYRFK